MSTTNPNLDAGIQDALRLAHANQQRSGATEAWLDDVGIPPVDAVVHDQMTFPTARNKEAAFICGCTVEVDPVSENDDVSAPPAFVREAAERFKANYPKGIPNSAKNATPKYLQNRKNILGGK